MAGLSALPVLIVRAWHYLSREFGSTTHSRLADEEKTKTMFDKMISHFAGEKAKTPRASQTREFDSAYVRQLRTAYRDVYTK
jgi:hypothetical protein